MEAGWHYQSRHNQYTFPSFEIRDGLPTLEFKRIDSFIERFKAESILDYGCGLTTALDHLSIPVQKYDPFVPEHNKYPEEPADLVVCYNVLNVVEDEFFDRVVQELLRFSKKAVVVSIMTPGFYNRPAKFYLPYIEEPVFYDIGNGKCRLTGIMGSANENIKRA